MKKKSEKEGELSVILKFHDPIEFYNVTRRLLEERLVMVQQGQTPPFTDVRHLFYEARNKFLRENPEFIEIDSKAKRPYVDFGKVIKRWCKQQARQLGIPKTFWWRVRERLNIWAEGKALCEGESGTFLVDKDTRAQTRERCSFILVCEKKTVRRELLSKLQAKGYKLNLVSTGGTSTADVQEAVLQIAEDLSDQDPTFYLLVLHDYDLDGLMIYFNLKERYEGTIDVGINSEFIQALKAQGEFDPRFVEEQRLNKRDRQEILDRIKVDDNYTDKDFEYLQGEPFTEVEQGKPQDRWRGKRIEIDAVHVKYGIEPFVTYILQKIQAECTVWDLRRIGVSDFDLEEPPDHYKEKREALENKVGKAYARKKSDLIQARIEILDLVRVTLPIPEAFDELDKKYRDSTSYYEWTKREGSQTLHWQQKEIKGVDKIEEEFQEQIEREWKPDFEGDLQEINEQVPHYEGDVREGEEDLQKQVDELQEKLEKAKEDDSDLEPFKERLDDIDWGEEELKKLEPLTEAEGIHKVLQALQKRLEELENDPSHMG